MQTDRLPPGQRLIGPDEFPVLDLGFRPEFDDSYRFSVDGLVNNPIEFTYQELLDLPKTNLTADFHCVTRWSKYDIKWGGVAWQDLVELVKPQESAKYVIQYSLDNYSTNVPLSDLTGQKNIILAYELDGKPLPREHGAPARMIIPHLYGWKGAKFLHKLSFKSEDEPGFWETRGYHNHGDIWTEERYS